MKKTLNKRGVTLIQVIIYLMLLTILVLATSDIINKTTNGHYVAMEQKKFISHKNVLYNTIEGHLPFIRNLTISDKEMTYNSGNTRHTFTLTEQGLQYTTDNYTKVFFNIKDVRFKKVSNICIEEGTGADNIIETYCEKTNNIIEVILINDYERKGSLYSNRGRRLFYVEEY